MKINVWFILAVILLCVATCDSCSGCRNNAKDLYCPMPHEVHESTFTNAPSTNPDYLFSVNDVCNSAARSWYDYECKPTTSGCGKNKVQ